MVKERTPRSPAQRTGPSAGGGSKPAGRQPKPRGRPGSSTGGQDPRNAPSHADYPEPEPPPDRVWEDRAG